MKALTPLLNLHNTKHALISSRRGFFAWESALPSHTQLSDRVSSSLPSPFAAAKALAGAADSIETNSETLDIKHKLYLCATVPRTPKIMWGVINVC